ncbi:hypothetical protein [Luteithermobacter gelatinilyticus]|uniref:hypothetical protein n=1 Tax=Luteithermobacter gelatinilyticus TaxID=2582913 RepID=UPI0011064540|nr:hypothetical protein [Luteithermobacter gelatinilyticus]|tara:strand:- start:53340 stop:53549 length:210 start_codon:yes stop_codon:yes gene_type:complete
MEQKMTLGILMGELGYALAPLKPLDRNMLVARLIEDAQRLKCTYETGPAYETDITMEKETWSRITDTCP